MTDEKARPSDRPQRRHAVTVSSRRQAVEATELGRMEDRFTVAVQGRAGDATNRLGSNQAAGGWPHVESGIRVLSRRFCGK